MFDFEVFLQIAIDAHGCSREASLHSNSEVIATAMDNYHVIQLVGEGSFGKVFKVSE